MTVSAASAAVASFSGLRGLAEAAGWAAELAWLLPVTIDAHATTSARVWLAASTRSPGARRFARSNALGAIAVSIAGNAAYHALGAGLITVSWPIVVAVGAIPAAVLGLTAHLHALRSRTEPGGSEASPASPDDDDRAPVDAQPPVPVKPNWPQRRTVDHAPKTRADDDLLTAARVADLRYRAEHDGRPITRDALRSALRIGGRRATELRRKLAAEPAGPTSEPSGLGAIPAELSPVPEGKESPNPDDAAL